jgi:hypothetical protein
MKFSDEYWIFMQRADGTYMVMDKETRKTAAVERYTWNWWDNENNNNNKE